MNLLQNELHVLQQGTGNESTTISQLAMNKNWNGSIHQLHKSTDAKFYEQYQFSRKIIEHGGKHTLPISNKEITHTLKFAHYCKKRHLTVY